MAKYDWLQALDAANANVYGDQSGAVAERIRKAAGTDYEDAVKAGIVGQNGVINWEKAPALPGYNSAGGDAPKNFSFQATGGRAGFVNPDGSAITSGYGGSPLYNDPNYGMQYMAQNRAPNDWQMNLGRSLATAAFAGPAAATFAPMIGGALGLGNGFNSTIAGLLKAMPGLVQSGGGNWMSVLGKILGGASGLPGGGTIGGLVGSYAQMTPAQRAALQRSMGGG